MAMIQGIDSMALLKALRAGREDRYQDEERAAKQRDAELKRQRQSQVMGLVGQLYGGQAPSVEGQFAPSQPQQKPEAFGQAAPSTPTAPAAGAAPSAAPQAAAPQAPARKPNPEVLRQLIILDPEMGGKIAQGLKTADEVQLKQLETRNMAMGAAAHWLAKMPEAERRQNFPLVAQQLLAAGWTEQELAQANLTDRGLQAYQWQSMDLDKLIDNELAEREFRMGKTVPVTAGGSVARIAPQMDAQGNVIGTTQEYVIGGGGQASPPADLPRVSSPDEARRLPPGTQFMMPDGRVGTVPGGPTPSASGGFRQ